MAAKGESDPARFAQALFLAGHSRVQRGQIAAGSGEGETLQHQRSSGACEALCFAAIGEQAFDGGGEGGRIRGRNDQARFFVAHRFGHSSDSRGHHRPLHQKCLDRAAEEHNALQASQERTRENLKVMPAGSDQQKEYVEKLSEFEKRIDQNEAAQAQMRETLSKFTSRVDDIIRTF